MDSDRLSIIEWALRIAEVTAQRSEDPHRRVGAVAVNHENRIVATAYNGLMPKFDVQMDFWEDRDDRLRFMIHAEQNLCSLFKRGEVKFVALTTQPCSSCLLSLLASGVKEVFYREPYDRDGKSTEIARFYGILLQHVPCEGTEHIQPGDMIHCPGYGFLEFGGQTEKVTIDEDNS